MTPRQLISYRYSIAGRGGRVSFRGSTYYKTTSGKLASLNKIIGVFEYEMTNLETVQHKFGNGNSIFTPDTKA